MYEPRFVPHADVEILRLDYGGVAHHDLLAAFATAGRFIRREPPRSLRFLTVLKSHFNAETAAALKQYGLANARPSSNACCLLAPSP